MVLPAHALPHALARLHRRGRLLTTGFLSSSDPESLACRFEEDPFLRGASSSTKVGFERGPSCSGVSTDIGSIVKEMYPNAGG